MPTYEMFWDCRSCGSTKLLGKTHRHCPNCGQAQDPSWRYFPSESEKVAVEDHVFVGVDWICERCDSANSAAATHCLNCGDARDGVEGDAKRLEDVEAGRQSGERDKERHRGGFEAPVVEEALASPPSSSKKRFVLLALLTGGVVFVVLVLVALFWTSPTEVVVLSHSWERSVVIEKLQATSDGTWCDSMPGDAYSVSTSRQERSSRSVADGETCTTVNSDNGDGTFSTSEQCTTTYHEEPVYDDWCSYTVDRWLHHDTVRAAGTALSPAPAWPTVKVSDCGSLGCTRQGGRRGSYYVHLLDADQEDQVCDLDQQQWAGMPVGSRWKAQKRVLLDNLVCSGLEPLGGA